MYRIKEPDGERDPSDEPQQYEPPSASMDPDSNLSLHHQRTGQPHQLSYDLARDQQSQRPQPQQLAPRSPVQSPMFARGMDNNLNELPPPQDYQAVTYPSAPGQAEVRKATRAAQACDGCRKLKAKCDEGRPTCSGCNEKATECCYRTLPPKPQDTVLVAVMAKLTRLESLITHLSDVIDKIVDLAGEVSAIKHGRNGTATSANHKVEARDEHAVIITGTYPRPSISWQNQPLHSNQSPSASTPSQLETTNIFTVPDSDTPEEGQESDNPSPSNLPSIPVNHTTGAVRLLNVPVIRILCQGAIDSLKIGDENYPMFQEERRGPLRLFGRGEGYGLPPGYDKDSLVDHTDSTPSISHSDISSPAGEEWGQLSGLSPIGHQPEFIGGGIDANGMPDLSRETVNELVKSYMDHINIMHPIFSESHLNLLVEHFLKSIPQSYAEPKQVSALQRGQTSYNKTGLVESRKRRRSPTEGEYLQPRAMLDHNPGHPFRSIESAIVLLVMALGKTCQHKGKIPDAWHSDRDLNNSYGSSPTVRNGHPLSHMERSPGIGMTSSLDEERGQSRSRRIPIDACPAGSFARPRNIDIIPGLAYLALATNILGNQLARNSLQYVHANILAGLYHGQLARVMESHRYITAACRSLQVILRPELDRLRGIKEASLTVTEKDNPLLIAFWTCLQLESDIIAELPCPHSGILTYEEDMPYPYLPIVQGSCGIPSDVMRSYMGQLLFRKHLNQLHNMFYRPDEDTTPFSSASKPKECFPTINGSIKHLLDIKDIATKKTWEPTEGEPATDILEARIRAKYYGAEVITYRHFVLKVLEQDSTGESGNEIAPGWLPIVQAPAIKGNLDRNEGLDAKVLDYAKCGIRALIFSTRAFYGLGDPGKERLIVTNVWGTAHAQWGNMVTLQAAYMNPILKQILLTFITVEELRELTEKTLSFLASIASPTSALHSDYMILKYMANNTGITAGQDRNTGSNFSSSNTEDISMSGQSIVQHQHNIDTWSTTQLERSPFSSVDCATAEELTVHWQGSWVGGDGRFYHQHL